MTKDRNVCRWVSLQEALEEFVLARDGHKGQGHIKPLHWYVACRLVLEGGFLPEEITPRPPFVATRKNRRWVLSHDESRGGGGEQTVLGGLKTKDVDVVVSKPNIGPCMAISLKGTLNAFRNLTNRMEEAAGDCTNLHLFYPALVYGFWSLLRANTPGPIASNATHILRPTDSAGIDGNRVRASDLALGDDGRVVSQIEQYGHALEGLAGRNGVRDDASKYEAVALSLINPNPEGIGQVLTVFPPRSSTLSFDSFFPTLYREYDLRFVYQAPSLKSATMRRIWSPKSSVFADPRDPRIGFEMEPRRGDEEMEQPFDDET